MKKRVVITGLGIVSPLGCGKEAFWNNLIEGKSGIAPMTSLDLSPYKCKLGSEVRDLKPEVYLGSKGLKYLNKGTRFLGSASTISAGFTSSADAIGDSYKMIQRDMAKIIVAGGVEQISIDLYLIFYLRGLLSGLDGTKEVSLPFDKDRNGFVMSEGSYVVILEELQHALDRGAHISAEIKGFGSTFVGGIRP